MGAWVCINHSTVPVAVTSSPILFSEKKRKEKEREREKREKGEKKFHTAHTQATLTCHSLTHSYTHSYTFLPSHPN